MHDLRRVWQHHENFSITAAPLLATSLILPQGGVVRVMELQEQGYIYLRA